MVYVNLYVWIPHIWTLYTTGDGFFFSKRYYIKMLRYIWHIYPKIDHSTKILHLYTRIDNEKKMKIQQERILKEYYVAYI